MPTLREQIERCRKLKQNWDSYGAPAIPASTIDFALLVAERVADIGITMACPTNDGGMELSDGDTGKWIKILTDEETA